METFPVLVVEDDPHIRRMLDMALRRAGYIPTIVASVSAALHALTITTFATILTDYGFTNQTGRVVIEHAQRLASPPAIVLMTGHSRAALADRLTDLSITAFLPKPFTLTTLYATLDQCRAPHRLSGDYYTFATSA